MPAKLSKGSSLRLIAESSIYGNLGLFIGAGMSMAILNSDWKEVALSWKQLIFKCAKEFEIELGTDIKMDGLSYPDIATEIATLISEKEKIEYSIAVKKLKEKISELTSWYPESQQRMEYGDLLLNISPSWIITTNYDLIIESLLTGKCLSLGPDDQLISPRGLIPIYHLHGIRTNPNSIIITQEDYVSLFRPNQYRQQKLSLSIKESTTVIIGYSLGDVNVLTAVDWSKNVYSNQRINYPNEIIQLLFKENPKKQSYRDRNNILIVEFNDLQEILNEISELIKSEREIEAGLSDQLHEINELLKNSNKENVEKFIDDESYRDSIIEAISRDDVQLISGFLELFSKSIDETWERAKPNGAFYAYAQNLALLLDIIEKIPLTNLPPALLEAVTYNLDRLAYYIGLSYGQSRSAYRIWDERKAKIPKDTLIELKNITRSRNYYRLSELLGK